MNDFALSVRKQTALQGITLERMLPLIRNYALLTLCITLKESKPP